MDYGYEWYRKNYKYILSSCSFFSFNNNNNKNKDYFALLKNTLDSYC